MNSESLVRETTLDNGVRVVTERVPSMHSIALGLRVDAGARDERDEQTGISHLLEHMLFKGTERRTAQEIAEALDAVGGHIDAFTSKEYTGYSARVLPEHVPLALDVLGDMLRRSLMTESELELEKGVIVEEYKSLEDSAEEFVHEVFSRTLWPTHPLGRSVIGRPETVCSFTRQDLFDYLAEHYVPSRLIWVADGNVDHDAFVREVDAQFGDLTGDAPQRELSRPDTSTSRELISRPTEQAHFVMGVEGVSEADPERWAARVLNLILGGGMSARLFQEIREKRGLCYSIASESSSFRESGMFIVYADTSPEHLEEVYDLSRQELLNVAKNGIRAEELARAKDQVRAATLLSLDDVGSRMNRLARNLLFHGRVIPLAELMAKVEALTLEDCQRVADRLFGSGEFAFTAIGPFKGARPKAPKRKKEPAN